MIVTEYSIRSLVSLIPEIRLNSSFSKKPVFGWGSKNELNRNIEEYKSSIYPLIWLLPSIDTQNLKKKTAIKKCEFVIATLEARRDILNPDRYNLSFENVLNPLTKDLLTILDGSSITRLIDYDVDIFKHPNYTEKEGVIDLWDAVKITCNVEFNSNCLKDFKWQERKLI